MVQTTCIVSLCYPTGTLAALCLETARVASFFVCTENGSAPKIFGYQAVLYLDRYRTRLCDMPSAEPIAKGSGHA